MSFIVSSDTDVYVNLVYHLTRRVYADLEKLWIISGKKGSENAILIHVLRERLDDRIIEILPAIHAITGWLISYHNRTKDKNKRKSNKS